MNLTIKASTVWPTNTMKKSSSSLKTGKYKSKLSEILFVPVRMVDTEKTRTTSADEDVEKKELILIVGGNVHCCSLCEKQCEGFSQLEILLQGVYLRNTKLSFLSTLLCSLQHKN